MAATVLLALFGVGLAVGFLSGLVGIGGGVLIVPFLYFFYSHPHWSGVVVTPGVEVAVAHATSLAIIAPTALRGILSYQRAGLVAWRVVWPIALFSVLAAVVGARLALVLPAPVLKVLFGLLLVGSAARMVWGRVPEEARAARPTVPRAAVTGILVGLLSALLGVGGGLIAIPMLVSVMRLPLSRVAATSLAVVLFSALSGVMTYMVSGWGVEGLPPGSLGYVHLTAAVPMLVGSLLAVAWGARVNQRTPAHRLRWVFAVLFSLFGLQLIVENLGALT